MDSKHYLPASSTGTHPYAVSITPESAGWRESSLWVVELGAGDVVERQSGDDEVVVVPLSGAVTVGCGVDEFALAGRHSVFDGPTDFAYVGRDSAYRVASANGARVALCGARARRQLPFRYGAAAEVPVELIEDDTAWSPYLTPEDIRKLDTVRLALRRGDIAEAAKHGRVFELKPVAAE